MKLRSLTTLMACLSFTYPSLAHEQGRWLLGFNKDKVAHLITKSMSKNTFVNIALDDICNQDPTARYEVSWLMLLVGCYGRITSEDDCYDTFRRVLDVSCVCGFDIDDMQFRLGYGLIDCGRHNYIVQQVSPVTDKKDMCVTIKEHSKRRSTGIVGKLASEIENYSNRRGQNVNEQPIARSWSSGQYSTYIAIKRLELIGNPRPDNTTIPKDFKVKVSTRNELGGLLSEADFPFLYFYLVMTLLHAFYAIIWLIMMTRYWKDQLWIQKLIALTIILSIAESVIFYALYDHVNRVGETIRAMEIVGSFVEVVRGTLCRALVMLLAVGFGTVKPQLDTIRRQLIIFCFGYLLVASGKPCLEIAEIFEPEKNFTALLTFIELSVMQYDVLFVYLALRGLRGIKKALRLKDDITETFRYKMFANLLGLLLPATTGRFLWALWTFILNHCKRSISRIWLDIGITYILSSITLLVIMVLWRPSNNYQSRRQGPHKTKNIWLVPNPVDL